MDSNGLGVVHYDGTMQVVNDVEDAASIIPLVTEEFARHVTPPAGWVVKYRQWTLKPVKVCANQYIHDVEFRGTMTEVKGGDNGG